MRNDVFPENFRDFVESLNKYEVDYLVIGGYAMGAYGHLRGTNDLDIFINATESNADKMMMACRDFGIPVDSLRKEMRF